MSEVSQFRKLSVLMPVYNERWTLEIIVQRVLTSPVALEIELVMVDDCSTDGSWDLMQEMARRDSRIRAVRHRENGGKGTAIRTAISHMTGDLAVVQDADLEYDPHEFPALVAPIVEGRADAVFGSRYASPARRVPGYWHTQVNRFLTYMSNLCTGLLLTDMETCYKVIRADVLRSLRLTSATFTLEPEITIRLAQWGARIYEVPISYAGRSFDEGKKIRPIDGLKALGAMARYRFFDRRFTTDDDFATLKACDRAPNVQRAILAVADEYTGRRVLHLNSGIGTLAGRLLGKDRVILAESHPVRAEMLRQRFSRRANLTIEQASSREQLQVERWKHERVDTVLVTDWLSRGLDEEGLAGCADLLSKGGKLLFCFPLGQAIDPTDHLRRHGLDVTHTEDIGLLPNWVAKRLPEEMPKRIRAINRLWGLTRLVPSGSGTPMFRFLVCERRVAPLRRMAA